MKYSIGTCYAAFSLIAFLHLVPNCGWQIYELGRATGREFIVLISLIWKLGCLTTNKNEMNL